MSNEIEYIEPTQEHAGQMVEVRDNNLQEWRQRKLLGVINYCFRFIVEPEGFGLPLPYKYARIPRPLTYAERQARCGLKVGDIVRILTLPESGQNGWKAGMSGSMRHLVGTVHPITHDCKEYGFTVAGWNLPYFVLEKVADAKAPEFVRESLGKIVLYINNTSDRYTIEQIYCDRTLNNSLPMGIIRSTDGSVSVATELSNLRVIE